jgi:predicted alpha-1,2-mannosidase
MKFLRFVYLFIGVLLLVNCATAQTIKKTPVDYVNPYIGNISHLLKPTVPTVHLPNSMFRFSPQRADFTSDVMNGFSLDSRVILYPYQGDESGVAPSYRYSYDQEKITPYSYSVYLDDQQIAVRLAPSRQSAMYEIEYGASGNAYMVINSSGGELNWNGTTITGKYGLGNNVYGYICLVPENKPTDVLALNQGQLSKPAGNDVCLVLKFNAQSKIQRLKFGISFIDEVQARKNLDREIKNFDIAQLEAEGKKIWNEALGKIAVTGGTDNEKAIFYTALYRSYSRPFSISEDGRYFSAFDGKVHDDKGRPFYTNDGIWDTYRALHPLQVLIDPVKEENIINSFVLMAQQSEKLWMPTFPGVTGSRHVMNCNHGVASVIDAYRKGLKKFDLETAFQACKGAITEKTLAPWSGMPAGKLDAFYKEHGYFPALHEGEKETEPEVNSSERRQTIAVTLGTSYDEWCLSQIAKELGKTGDAAYFAEQSLNYRKLYNAETGFFHPKDKEGKFIEPFDYVFSGGAGARDYYDENNGWTYRWDVQHNIADIIELMGGPKKFVQNLNEMYVKPLGRSKYAFYAQLPDQSGNVGQFSMGNEPSLHIPYLYNYAGQPWETQKRVRSLIKQWFRNDLMGIPGDEDGGGLSSFVVFSCMGFYPVTPGIPAYNIGSPYFPEIKVDLGNGHFFEIIAQHASDENKYIQSATLNGQPMDKPWFKHDDIIKGGKLVLVMGAKANKTWGSSPEAVPPSFKY